MSSFPGLALKSSEGFLKMTMLSRGGLMGFRVS